MGVERIVLQGRWWKEHLVELAFDQMTQFMAAGSEGFPTFVIGTPNLIPIWVIKTIHSFPGVTTNLGCYVNGVRISINHGR